MKNYICSILLLICGLAHFATQVQGDCQFGAEVLKVGLKTIPPCSGIVCNPDGYVYTVKCQPGLCEYNEDYVGRVYEDDNKPYPGCCAKTICINRFTNEIRYAG